MDEPEVLRWDDYAVVPWLNGLGETREVARQPVGWGADGFDWRVSIAHVAGRSTFSAFPGVDRIILPLDATPLRLTVDGAERVVGRHEAFAFAGEAVTSCLVDGAATRDLNVMTRRDGWTARVQVIDGPSRILSGRGEVTIVVALTGAVALDVGGGPTYVLGELDALWLPGPGPGPGLGQVPVTLATPGRVASIHLTPHSATWVPSDD